MLADALLQECILKVVVEKTPSSSGMDTVYWSSGVRYCVGVALISENRRSGLWLVKNRLRAHPAHEVSL